MFKAGDKVWINLPNMGGPSLGPVTGLQAGVVERCDDKVYWVRREVGGALVEEAAMPYSVVQLSLR